MCGLLSTVQYVWSRATLSLEQTGLLNRPAHTSSHCGRCSWTGSRFCDGGYPVTIIGQLTGYVHRTLVTCYLPTRCYHSYNFCGNHAKSHLVAATPKRDSGPIHVLGPSLFTNSLPFKGQALSTGMRRQVGLGCVRMLLWLTGGRCIMRRFTQAIAAVNSNAFHMPPLDARPNPPILQCLPVCFSVWAVVLPVVAVHRLGNLIGGKGLGCSPCIRCKRSIQFRQLPGGRQSSSWLWRPSRICAAARLPNWLVFPFLIAGCDCVGLAGWMARLGPEHGGAGRGRICLRHFFHDGRHGHGRCKLALTIGSWMIGLRNCCWLW